MKHILHCAILGIAFLITTACASSQYREVTGMPIQPLSLPITLPAHLPGDQKSEVRTPLPLTIGLDLRALQSAEMFRGGAFTGWRRGQGFNLKIGSSSARLFREGFTRNFEKVKPIEESISSTDYDLVASPQISCIGGRVRDGLVFHAAIRYQLTLTDRDGNTNVVTSRMEPVIYDRPFTWKDWLVLPVYILGFGFSTDIVRMEGLVQAFTQAEIDAYQDLESKLRGHFEERRLATGAYDRLIPSDEDPGPKVRQMINAVLSQIPSIPIRHIAIGDVVRNGADRTTVEDQILFELWTGLAETDSHKRLTFHEMRDTLNQMAIKPSDLIDPKNAKQFASYTGADTLFIGTTTERGESLAVGLKVIDISSGRTVAAGEAVLHKVRIVPSCREELDRLHFLRGPDKKDKNTGL